jgi:hypothetical protein
MNVAYRIALGIGAITVLIPSRTSGWGEARTTSPMTGRAECKVEGVWELVSLTFDGREMKFLSRPERKIVARGHWIWLGADARRDTLPLRTAADSLRATRIVGGAGTYTTTDSTFTQQIEFFFDPSAEGMTLVATCRTDGERWYYTYDLPPRPGAGGRATRVSEVWRRLS